MVNIPIVLCIDLEPDPRLVDRYVPEPWVGWEFTYRYLSDLRPRIEAISGAPAHYAWFLRMDPQIAEPYGSATWVVDRYPAQIEDLRRNGDALGVHPHPYRWLEAEQTWLHDFANQEWVNHCLEMSLDAFAQALGVRCELLRFGDRWLNTPTLNLAERLGVRYDLTVEPGCPPLDTPMEGEDATGFLPDYYRVPRVPYVPSQTDFRRRQRRRRDIRIIPLTSAHLRLGLRPRAQASRLRTNGLRYWRQDTPLSMWREWKAPNTFGEMLDRALAAQRRPYLAFAIRTDIGSRPKFFNRVDGCLQALLAHPAASRFVFCSPAEALAMLE